MTWNPYISGADPAAQRTAEYAQMMAGLDLVSGQELIQPPAYSAGLDLVPAAAGPADLAAMSGYDLISGADPLLAELIASGAISPTAGLLARLPPNMRAGLLHAFQQRKAVQQQQFQRMVNQPRIEDRGPTAYKEQTENLSRVAVAAGGEYAWTFTILGRAAKLTDLILPDNISEFFDVLSALVGNNNLFHGGGAAYGGSFAASARRTGFESDTVPAGSLVTIRFKNQDGAAHTLAARAKLKIMY